MKAVILAGGFGTRLSEETSLIPKPLIPIGDNPILWHIMKTYASHGITEFIICLGYKGNLIKEYFSSYFLHNSDVTFDLSDSSFQIHGSNSVNWKVTLVDTGLNTMTAGRLKSVEPYIKSENFCLTYGDGVADININELLKHHEHAKKMVTITAIRPKGRFGALILKDDLVTSFKEKISNDTDYINGGFFVLNKKVFNALRTIDSNEPWEGQPIQDLVQNDEVTAFRHNGFWQSMDTLKEKNFLNEIWNEGKAPWKIW